jgi:putative hydrolase of the HAD superfamily
MKGYLIWDFDDTLAYSTKRWAGILHELLLVEMSNHSSTIEEVRNYTKSGFYWHTPEVGHTHIQSRNEWWEGIYPQLELALTSNNVEPELAKKLARDFPAAYLELSNWRLFDDTLLVLQQLSSHGWKHLILSNHVPELEALVKGLGLSAHIEKVFNSALIGYEKPHPEIFRCVLKYLDGAQAWMIGDNPVADVQGANALGIPAILVRKPFGGVNYFCKDLFAVSDMLNGVV